MRLRHLAFVIVLAAACGGSSTTDSESAFTLDAAADTASETAPATDGPGVDVVVVEAAVPDVATDGVGIKCPGCHEAGGEAATESAAPDAPASDAGADDEAETAEACVPVGCPDKSFCGNRSDGCGATIDCGGCPGGTHCDGAGTNRCGVCQPRGTPTKGCPPARPRQYVCTGDQASSMLPQCSGAGPSVPPNDLTTEWCCP